MPADSVFEVILKFHIQAELNEPQKSWLGQLFTANTQTGFELLPAQASG